MPGGSASQSCQPATVPGRASKADTSRPNSMLLGKGLGRPYGLGRVIPARYPLRPRDKQHLRDRTVISTMAARVWNYGETNDHRVGSNR
jgi:hypothetical protein